MLNRSAPFRILWFATALAAAPVLQTARAQQEPAVISGVEFLRQRRNPGTGEAAMMALAFIKAEVPLSDPALAACLSKIDSRFSSSAYTPERAGGQEIYEAGVIALALANLDPSTRIGKLEAVASYIISQQKPGGGWDYTARTYGDTSISQYAVLGLWECENTGVDVPPSVWDRAAQWYMKAQSPAGGWNYHRDEATEQDTISMTAAGVGSLLICRRQLEKYQQFQKGSNPYLTPIETGAPSTDYHVVVNPSQVNAAIAKGMSWIGARFNTRDTITFGRSIYYGLYGIERVGALSDRERIGKVEWFEQARAFIRSSQGPKGSWTAQFGEDMNTVWAILFLTKATSKTLKRIEIHKLGGGTLLGGRYLPSDLSTMTIAGGRVISRPMNGAVEGMLDLLEDPRIQNADKAVAGMIERYHTEGPSALRPHKDRLRKMLGHRDPGVRQVAAWALARTGDLDVTPNLIDALQDVDPQTAATARQGLQLISRKIDGPAAADPASPEARKAEAAEWKSWYDLVRPLDASDGLDDEPAATPTGRPS